MNEVIEAWEDIFSKRTQLTQYPFSDVVTLLHRHKHFLPEKTICLELGCGPGPNIQLIKDLQYDYYGIEGSLTATIYAKNRHPDIKIITSDFCEGLPFMDHSFNLVFDRSAITHNKAQISNIFDEIIRVLVPGGLFIGVDYFSKLCFEYSNMKQSKAENRYQHALFCNDNEIKELLRKFQILYLRSKTHKNIVPDNNIVASYDFVVQKK